jgi:anti-anti-sigma regulatory factor
MTTDAPRQRERFSGGRWSPAGDRIVLDMTDVRYCDSSCLRVLLRLGTRLRDLMPAHPTVGAVLATWGEEA